MKKRLLFVISIVVLSVVLSTVLFSCATATVLEGKDYDKQVDYYNGIVEDVKKCESTLDALMNNLSKSSFISTFTLERTYFSSANDNKAFKGSQTTKGYNEADDCKDVWMVEAIKYEIKYKNGEYQITAAVKEDVKADDYDEDAGKIINTYTYTKLNDAEPLCTGGNEDVVKHYCVEKVYDVIFGKFTSNEFLENYATSASKGWRIYTSMMQYQTTRAFAYTTDGGIDLNKAIKYTDNKGKILYTALTESFDGKDVVFSYEGNSKPATSDDVAYWDFYKDDITYNFYKVSAIYNDRITMTYKGSKDTIESFEYYGEVILPFYTKKSKFQTYNVLKCVVADYTHFVVKMDYETSFKL